MKLNPISFLKNGLQKFASILTGHTDRLNDPNFWRGSSAFPGFRTLAGQTVTPVNATTLSAYYACQRVIGEDLGKVPWMVFERLAEGGKQRLTTHPAWRLIHDRPNPEMSPMSFKEAMAINAQGWGNGYAEIEFNLAGDPINLWPIYPSNVRIRRDEDTDELFYEVRLFDTIEVGGRQIETVRIPENRMFHILNTSTDGIHGISVARVGAESIGHAIATQKFGASFFGNGAHVSGVLTHPGELSDEIEARMRRSWNSIYQGPNKSNQIAILEEGTTFNKISIPPEEAQYLQTRMFNVEEICRWHRVPPHKVQHLQRSTFSNIEMQSREYVVDTLLSWTTRFQEEANRKLIKDSERETIFTEFVLDALLQGDSKARAEFYTKLFMLGSISSNEIRSFENMNPVEGGDQHFIPLNMAPLETASQEMQNTETQTTGQVPGGNDPGVNAEEVINSLESVLFDAAEKVSNKEKKAVQRATKKYKDDNISFASWSEKFYAEHEQYIFTAFMPVAETASQLLNIDSDELEKEFFHLATTFTGAAKMASPAEIMEGFKGAILERTRS